MPPFCSFISFIFFALSLLIFLTLYQWFKGCQSGNRRAAPQQSRRHPFDPHWFDFVTEISQLIKEILLIRRFLGLNPKSVDIVA